MKNREFFINLANLFLGYLLIWFREYWSSRSMHLMFACVKWPVTNLTSCSFVHIMTIEPFSLDCNFPRKKKLFQKVSIEKLLQTGKLMGKVMKKFVCLLIICVIFSVLSTNAAVKWQFANSAAANGDRSPIEIIGIFARSKMSCKIGQYVFDDVTIYSNTHTKRGEWFRNRMNKTNLFTIFPSIYLNVQIIQTQLINNIVREILVDSAHFIDLMEPNVAQTCLHLRHVLNDGLKAKDRCHQNINSTFGHFDERINFKWTVQAKHIDIV